MSIHSRRSFVRLAGGATAGVLLAGALPRPASAATLPRVRPLGTVTVDGKFPYSFSIRSDGNVWLRSYRDGLWSWSNLGKPHHSAIISPLGAVSTHGRYPRAYLTSDDSNVWSIGLTPRGVWNWSHHRRPPEMFPHWETMAFGVVTHGGVDRVFSDHGTAGLWELTAEWVEGTTRWRAVGDGGRSEDWPYGTVLIGDTAHVFTRREAGGIWLHSLGAERKAVSLGLPTGVTPKVGSEGAVAINNGTHPALGVIGSDGNLWGATYNGTSGGWQNMARPAGVTPAAVVGAVNVRGTRPHVFVTATDGTLWALAWTGTAWAWSGHGRPAPGVSVGEAHGTVALNDASRAFLFFRGSDGNLWSHWWTGTEWRYTDHGAPAGL